MNAAELRTKAPQLKTRIHALTSERNDLAPLAVNGDARGPKARKRIRAIDAERADLLSELETIEAVLARPEYRDAAYVQRLDDTAAKYFARRQQALRTLVANEHSVIASGAYALVSVDRLPRKIAAELTGETEAQREWDNRNLLETCDANKEVTAPSLKIDRLAAKLAALKRHTEQLLASTNLPVYEPPEVDPVTGQRVKRV